MRTQKNISNISYHTPEYFGTMTNTLKKAGLIASCYWIAHKGEEGDKDHIHLILIGGQKVYNTQGLSSLWGVEVLKDGGKSSLTERWTPTKRIEDWICYGIHDVTYLLRKGLEREHSYTWDDIKCTDGDEDMLRRDIISARRLVVEGEDKIYRALRVMAKQGKSWHDVIVSGLIPVNCLGASWRVWTALKGEGVIGYDTSITCPRGK